MKTRKSFYRALRKAAGKFKWSMKGNVIRGHLDGLDYCPITAVFFDRTDVWMPATQYSLAADDLELSYENSENIADSADNLIKFGDGTKSTRAAILRAVGLDKPATV